MRKDFQINYSIYAKQKREIKDFEITINDLNVLSDYIYDDSYIFNCNFSFFEEKKHACVKYKISSHLKLICQDFLEPFDYTFTASNSIIILEDDRLAKDSLNDPFICKGSILDLRDIIKEEVLLDLPLVPKNTTNTCKITKKRSYYSEQKSVIEEKISPFEVLRKLE